MGAWALRYPDNAEKVFGWIAGGVGRLWRKVDRTAVAYKVQGEINSAGTALMKNSPPDLLEKKLKIKWADADQAATLIKEGEVLVVMQPSRHHEENVAHALMAYLPKAMLPRARPYLDIGTRRCLSARARVGVRETRRRPSTKPRPTTASQRRSGMSRGSTSLSPPLPSQRTALPDPSRRLSDRRADRIIE